MFRILISKVVVLTITAGLLAFGVYGSVNIVQRFEERRGKEGFLKKVLIEIFFIPADTGSTQSGCYHGATTCHTQNQYWPSYGLQVQVSFFDENDLLPSS